MRPFLRLAVLSVLLLITPSIHAQTASVVWSLSGSTTVTPSSSGPVSGQNQTLSGGTNPTLSILGYPAQGQALWAGTNGWNASPEALDRFIQFDAAPNAGYSWVVNQVSFEYGFAGLTGNVASNVYYSTDLWNTRTLLTTGGPLVYAGSTLGVYSAPISVPVPAGNTFSVRIYPYAVVSQVAASPQRATHNSFTINGEASPVNTACVEPPAGLNGWWTGDLTGTDLSGNGLTATGALSYAPGMVADAFSITGYTDLPTVADTPLLDPAAGNFSFDFWFKTASPTASFPLLSKWDGTSGYLAHVSQGQLYVQINTSTASIASSSPVTGLNDGQWHFVAVTLDRQDPLGLRLYVDGNPPVETDPTSLGTSSIDAAAPLLIGGLEYPNNLMPHPVTMTGLMDEVEYFSSALSGSEVEALFLAGSSGKCKNLTGSIGGYKFEDADGNGLSTGDQGLGGFVIQVHEGTTLIGQTVTAADGTFSLDVPPGTYTVSEVQQNGWTQTAPVGGVYVVTVGPGSETLDLVFGNRPVTIGVCVAPPPDMVGWWPAEQDATDLSGTGNDGQQNGTVTYQAGVVGSSFEMLSANDYVRVPHAMSLEFGVGDDLSIDAWVRTISGQSTIAIVDKRAVQGFWQTGYGLWIVNGQLAFRMEPFLSAPTTFVSTGPNIADGAWHFVAVTLDRDNKDGLVLYVDQHKTIFDPTGLQQTMENAGDLLIGRHAVGATAAFRGGIDELELFRRALTEDEIESIRDAGQAGKCRPDDTTVCDLLNVTTLSLATGVDHSAGTLHPIDGNDPLWSIVADPDTSLTTPRPATVAGIFPGWTAAQAGSRWLAPGLVVPGATAFASTYIASPGLYTYALEFCIVGDDAVSLAFDLSFLADNSGTIYLVSPSGVRTLVGATGGVPFGTPSIIQTTLPGPFPEGTYRIEIDVYNLNGPSGINLTGGVTGANLYMQRHDCCNRDIQLTGFKFMDADGDGEYDSGVEPLMANALITISDGSTSTTTTTDAAGNWYFSGPPGTYTITEEPMAGYTQTYPAAGGHTSVTVASGGIMTGLSFGNRPDSCLSASSAWTCLDSGTRALTLTVTNQTAAAVSGITVSSTTPGVSYSIVNSPAYPLAPNASVTLSIVPSGLGAGQTADLIITMTGPVSANGLSEVCCQKTIQIRRPGKLEGPLCLHVVDGTVMVKPNDVAGPLVTPTGLNLVVRAGEGRGGAPAGTGRGGDRFAPVDDEGNFLFEGLPSGTYTVSLDTPFGWMTTTPDNGPYIVSLDSAQPAVSLDFVLTSSVTQTGSEDTGLPTVYALDGNYPNPFNPQTRIRYALPAASNVRLEVSDMLGRPVALLVDSEQPAGYHDVVFDARNVASGTYIYRLQAGNQVFSRIMTVIK